jgi:uncharacterized protein (TIGR02466 family)
MASTEKLFVTHLRRAAIAGPDDPFLVELDAACRAVAEDDAAGQRWCRRNGYPGYTSYASLNDLPWRIPTFRELKKRLDREVADFAKELEFDLGGRKLELDSLWINVLPEGGVHTSHIHPRSVISGTIYVAMPDGASAIKFEDPRHAMMMYAPPRRAKASDGNRAFIYRAPQPGEALFWESWLRHEVPVNQADSERITVSFNYRWG